MFNRFCFGALLFAGVAVSISGCNSSADGLDAIQVAPTSASLVVGGPTLQLAVTGTFGNGSHPTTKAVTTGLTWTSAIVGVATVDASGLVTPVSAGTTTITASARGFAGTVTSTATVTVTGGSSTGGGTQTVTSLAIIPNSQTVDAPPQTTQFIAIGTTSSGATLNLTSQVTWGSSSQQIATISTSGLATAVGKGTTTITALYTNPTTLTVVQGSATFTVTAGTGAQQITAIKLVPGSASLATSQTAQFVALGTNGTTGLQQIVTNSPQLQWLSSIPSIATVNSGLVTGLTPGTTSVTAFYTNSDGSVVASDAGASITVSSIPAPEPMISIKVVPDAVTVWSKGQSAQFLAFGTFSATPTVRDLTSQVTWYTSSPELATIPSGGITGEPGGLATAMGFSGNAVLYAMMTASDGTVVLSNPVSFTCMDPNTKVCDPGPPPVLMATLTVYNAGENQSTWQVTAPSDTGTPNLIHCGPGWSGAGGSVCTGTYAPGTTVTLTASPSDSSFGGWTSNCGTITYDSHGNATGYTPDLGPTCTLTLLANDSVGAIFY